MNRMLLNVILGCSCIMLCLAGCGGDGLTRVPIQGVVKAAGVPVPNAIVQFTPKTGTPGDGAIGQSDAEGIFTVISSRQDDAGVPPGSYGVRVSLMVDGKGKSLPPDATQADYPDAKEAIPAPYSLPDSPIQVTIDDKGGEVAVDIPVKIAALKK